MKKKQSQTTNRPEAGWRGSMVTKRGNLRDIVFLDHFFAWMTNLGVDRAIAGAFQIYRGAKAKNIPYRLTLRKLKPKRSRVQRAF